MSDTKVLSSKELGEEMGPLIHLINQMADKVQTEPFTAEETETWDRINKEYDRLKSQSDLKVRAEALLLEQVQTPEPAPAANSNGHAKVEVGKADFDGRDAIAKIEARENAAPTEADYTVALQGWVWAQSGLDLRDEHNEACRKCHIRPHMKYLDLPLNKGAYGNTIQTFRNAQSGVDGSRGGVTIPEGFIANLELALLQFGGVRKVADVMRTDTGNDLPWPTSDDTSNTGSIVGENVALGDATAVAFGQIIFRAHTWTSKIIKVPFTLMEDSAFNLAAILGSMLGERIGRIQNTHYTTGDGVNQPRGFVTACLGVASSGAIVSAAATGSISVDDIIDLIHGVDPAYRDGANFMLHDTVLQSIRKLKDGQGQLYWQPSVQAGVPDRLFAYPLVNNQSMDSTLTSGSESMAFGQFKKYKIRDVGTVRLVRLNERFADADQVGFVALARGDGNLLNAGTNPLKVLQH